jgi:transcriptional regulator with XRE-family HTH domain
MKTKFSETLSFVLLQKRLKQIDLANKSGVAVSIISRAVKHGSGLSTENFRAIVEAFGKGNARRNLIMAFLQDRAEELGADCEKVHYSSIPAAHNLATGLLPLFSEISKLKESNPGLITSIQKLVLLTRATAEEMENISSELPK